MRADERSVSWAAKVLAISWRLVYEWPTGCHRVDGTYAPLTSLAYFVLFAVFRLMSGAYVTNRSWIRANVVKARVLPCLGMCSGWGLLRVMKTFLGILTRVSTSVCTFPLIRFKLLCGCVYAIGVWTFGGSRNTACAQ